MDGESSVRVAPSLLTDSCREKCTCLKEGRAVSTCVANCHVEQPSAQSILSSCIACLMKLMIYLLKTSGVSCLVAINAVNFECDTTPESTDCDNAQYAVGWSPVVHLTQDIATPDAVKVFAVESNSKTELVLSWNPPVDNGAALSTYRVTCTDSRADYAHALDAGDGYDGGEGVGQWLNGSDGHDGGKGSDGNVTPYLSPSWIAPTRVQFQAADGGMLSQSMVVSGLRAGTEYTCALSSNNSAGGMDETQFVATARRGTSCLHICFSSRANNFTA
eukprot:6188282-Pleurochrysis_carterae.AAC.1